VTTGWLNKDRIRAEFFENLETIREKSVEYDTPFWAFVQTCRFSGMRNPSPAEARWHSYTVRGDSMTFEVRLSEGDGILVKLD
jgi:hypothetical protein